VQGSFSFVEDVVVCSSQHDGACAFGLAALEMDEFVFTDHDFLNQVTVAQQVAEAVGVVEGAEDVSSGHSTESLHSVEVCVFDADDAGLCEQLLRLVLDQLAVDEHVGFVRKDLLDFLLHLLLLGLLNLAQGDQ